MDSVPNTKCADLVDRFAEAVATSKSIGIIGLRDAPAQVSAPVAGQSPVSRRLHHRRP